ncbi:MAG: hypothetical protein ACYC06_07300 [Ilumatobacteraceae bacterium]
MSRAVGSHPQKRLVNELNQSDLVDLDYGAHIVVGCVGGITDVIDTSNTTFLGDRLTDAT